MILGNSTYYYCCEEATGPNHATMIEITTPVGSTLAVQTLHVYGASAATTPLLHSILKPVIWQASDGSVLSVGSPKVIQCFSGDEQWHILNFSTSPILQPNTNYYIGIVDTQRHFLAGNLNSGGYRGGTDSTNSYTSPQTYDGTTGGDRFAYYITCNTTQSLVFDKVGSTLVTDMDQIRGVNKSNVDTLIGIPPID